MENYVNYLVKWLQDKVKESKTRGLVLGVSGGVDSAVCAALVKRAFPDDSLALLMPCHSNKLDTKHGLLVTRQLNLKHKVIKLDKTYDILLKEIKKNLHETDAFVMAQANLKARLRMSTLYTFAQNNHYLVCGTDNRLEWYTGYFTKYGDGAVDIAPLIQLNKSDIYKMACYLGIDEAIINKKPTAGLIENVNDEDELQVSYDTIEAYLSGEEIALDDRKRIDYLHEVSEHKRHLALIPAKKLGEL
jgi:NAD+ synthase